MNKSRKYTETLPDAKKLYKLKTGYEYDNKSIDRYAVAIFKLKAAKTKTRKYFVGSYIEWLNL